MSRVPREVLLDWSRARAGRIPIVLEGRMALDFGERVVGTAPPDRQPPGGANVRGMVGWDPSLGWVLVLDPGQEMTP